MSKQQWKQLNRNICDCRLCDRLISHCQQVAQEKRKAYREDDYWGGPVPNFGDPEAQLLLLGLAPGAHGANRTGRMFTGDRSGDWLFRALYKAGFASQAESTSNEDGLKLINCAVTNVCHCAPPQNRPTAKELHNCQPWLASIIETLPVRVFLALGALGWNAAFDYFKSSGDWQGGRPAFGHGAAQQLDDGRWVLASYHPSQQNTFTGRLTEPMFDAIFEHAVCLLDS